MVFLPVAFSAESWAESGLDFKSPLSIRRGIVFLLYLQLQDFVNILFCTRRLMNVSDKRSYDF
jgi:hypothetical protein